MAHSWVQMFDSELEAFRTYCKCYPNGTVLLVDTSNVLKSGVPNAIKAFDEVLKPMGCRPVGIRIDSGDITVSKQNADKAGYPGAKYVPQMPSTVALIKRYDISGRKGGYSRWAKDLSPQRASLFSAEFTGWAVENDDGNIQPKIKISENVAKITTPHFKKLYRIYDKSNHKAVADLLCVHDEVMMKADLLRFSLPQFTWKKKVVTNFEAKPIQQQIFKDGKCVQKTCI